MLDRIGGEIAVASLAGEITSSANVAYHCRMLREKLYLRKLLTAAQTMKSLCLEPAASPESITGLIQSHLLSIMDRAENKPYRQVADYMHEAYETIVRRAESETVTGVPTGIARLDLTLDGLQPGDLSILAARPKDGKSALGGQIAVHAAEQGFPVGVFALEMKGRDMGIRFMSSKARRNLSPKAIRENKPNSQEWKRLSDVAAEISALPVFIDDTSGLSISQVYAKARRMQRDFDMKLLIVDYLQLMSGEGNEQSREREIAHISCGLKGIAKTLNIPVLALSQLSRKAVESEYRRPRLSDLRESGAIEQDADNVIFIFNPPPDTKTGIPDRKGHIPLTYTDPVRELIVEANRHGEVGSVFVYWQKEHVMFYNLEY
jgi:replicative DNA helicase